MYIVGITELHTLCIVIKVAYS